MAPQKLTEYERKRLENIRRNGQMIAALNLHAKASELSSNPKRLRITPSKSYKKSPEKKPKTESPVVIRRSLRTRGIAPEISRGLDDDYIESLNLSSALSSDSSPQKPSPRFLGPISMVDAYGGEGSYRGLLDAILSVNRKPQMCFSSKEEFDGDNLVKVEDIERVAKGVVVDENSNKEEFDGDNLVKGEDSDRVAKGVVVDENSHVDVSVMEEIDKDRVVKQELTDGIVNGMSKSVVKDECFDSGFKKEESGNGSCIDVWSLKLEAENVARILPGKIMVVKFLPCNDVRMIVAGNKFGNITFWNVDHVEEDADHGIYMYRPNNGPISGIVFQESCPSKIFTSCYDGFVRLMDADKETFDLVYSSDETIYSLSQRPNDIKSLYFGKGRGGLSIWDEREGKLPSEWNLHEDRINTIDFNPYNPYMMLTSSTDGTACLWDLRSMKANDPENLKVVTHNRAIHSAYFSPSGSSIATTGLDDIVGITSGINFEDTSLIYHNNQTGRWISSFRAIWGWDDSYVFIGNMKRGVDVISAAQRKAITTLQSPLMSAIPCRFAAHPYKLGMLAGATSGGQVYIWTSS